MSRTGEHLEHIEHAQHAAQSRFDRNVAISMAIVAACLACITLLSHRGHNETLQLQLAASIVKTAAADEWAHYQARKIRQQEYEAFKVLDAGMAHNEKLNGERKKAYDDGVKEWDKQLTKYQTELPSHEKANKDMDQDAEQLQLESHVAHEHATRFDLGELFAELALVLCSVALLTKRKIFWFAGIGSCALGMVLAASVALMPSPIGGDGNNAATATAASPQHAGH